MTTSWLEQDKPAFNFQALQSDEGLCGMVVKDPFVGRQSALRLSPAEHAETCCLKSPLRRVKDPIPPLRWGRGLAYQI